MHAPQLNIHFILNPLMYQLYLYVKAGMLKKCLFAQLVSWHIDLLFEITLIRETKGNIYVFALHTIAVIFIILSFYITCII